MRHNDLAEKIIEDRRATYPPSLLGLLCSWGSLQISSLSISAVLIREIFYASYKPSAAKLRTISSCFAVSRLGTSIFTFTY